MYLYIYIYIYIYIYKAVPVKKLHFMPRSQETSQKICNPVPLSSFPALNRANPN